MAYFSYCCGLHGMFHVKHSLDNGSCFRLDFRRLSNLALEAAWARSLRSPIRKAGWERQPQLSTLQPLSLRPATKHCWSIATRRQTPPPALDSRGIPPAALMARTASSVRDALTARDEQRVRMRSSGRCPYIAVTLANRLCKFNRAAKINPLFTHRRRDAIDASGAGSYNPPR